MRIRDGLLMLIASTVLCGCADNDATIGQNPGAGDAPQIPSTTPAELLTRPPETVLARVDGTELTLAEALKEIDTRARAMSEAKPAVDEGKLHEQLLGHVVDQFVMRRLLLDEANRRSIEPSEEEKAAAFDRIAERLPEGKTIASVMAESPMGEERMREEVLTGLRINKLFEQVLPKNPEVTDAEVAVFLEQNPDAKLPESVSARHILIKTSPEDSEAEKAAKRDKLEQLREKLVGGADFEALAKAHSECPSAQRGGDLGTFRRGQMVKPFEDAAFALEPGAISDLVETTFGYHLIRIDAHNKAGDVPRELIVKRIKQEKGKAAYEDFLKQLRDKADVSFPATDW